MSRRPLPLIPRGPKRVREKPRELIVGCPRICPVWQLQAVRALIKPQFKDAIAHRDSNQRWTSDDRRRAQRIIDELQARIAAIDPALARAMPEMHFPRAGDFRLIAIFSRARIGLAKKLAMELSAAIAGRWFVVANLYARDGRIYRRRGLRRLELAPVENLRLPRALQRV